MYKWDKSRGVVDESGNQILVLLAAGCSQKFRDTAGKALVDRLNDLACEKSAKVTE